MNDIRDIHYLPEPQQTRTRDEDHDAGSPPDPWHANVCHRHIDSMVSAIRSVGVSDPDTGESTSGEYFPHIEEVRSNRSNRPEIARDPGNGCVDIGIEQAAHERPVGGGREDNKRVNAVIHPGHQRLLVDGQRGLQFQHAHNKRGGPLGSARYAPRHQQRLCVVRAGENQHQIGICEPR